MNDIADLILRRRRQLLVHSIIYYKYGDSIVSDEQWKDWALELEQLQRDYPDIAAQVEMADDFKNFDHSTGYNLPLGTLWAVATAERLLHYRDIKEKNK